MNRSTPSRRRGSIARRCAVAATVAAVTAPFLVAGTAGAHVTPQDPEGPSGGYFTTAFKVGHGCDGSPTTKVAIKMAEGVTSVAPQPEAGWTLTTTTREVDPPVELHGTQITETTDEVIWEGGPLPDGELKRRLTMTWGTGAGILASLSTVDHKIIGRRYIITAFVFWGVLWILSEILLQS